MARQRIRRGHVLVAGVSVLLRIWGSSVPEKTGCSTYHLVMCECCCPIYNPTAIFSMGNQPCNKYTGTEEQYNIVIWEITLSICRARDERSNLSIILV